MGQNGTYNKGQTKCYIALILVYMNKNTSEKIKRYWLKDLTYKEIGLLVGMSERTVKREVKRLGLQSKEREKPLSVKAYELNNRGYSYTDIAGLLGIGRSTAFMYVKNQRLKHGNSQK